MEQDKPKDKTKATAAPSTNSEPPAETSGKAVEPAVEELSIESTFRVATKEDKAKEDKIKALINAAKDLDFQETHPDFALQDAIQGNKPSDGTGSMTFDGVSDVSQPEGQTDPFMTDMTDSLNIPLNPISFDDLYVQFYEPLTRIYGKLYEPAKKLTLYIGLANALKYNLIDDLVTHDMRINAMFCLAPGAGKRMLKRALMYSELPNKTFVRPTSYHPEHFVGKLSWDPKAKTTVNHKGYLEEDGVMIDEAKDLLRDPPMQQARKSIRVALDPIGNNEVVKQSIDVPENLRKRFESAATIVMFLQPDTYPDELATEGDLRRCIVSYFDVPHNIKEQIMDDKVLAGRPRRDKQWDRRDNYRKILLGLAGHRFSWDLSLIREELKKYATLFYEYACSRGPIATQVADDAYFDTILHLIRFSCVRAACEGREQPTLTDLQAAYADFWIFYVQTIDFCVKLLPGKFVTVATRKITTQDYEKIRSTVCWIADQGAFSPVMSRITPKVLTDWMVTQGWGSAAGSNGGSYRIYRLMKEHGFIEFQRHQQDCIIWLRRDKIPEQWKEDTRGSLVPL